MSFMQNVRAGNAGAGIGLDAAPYGTRPDGTDWTYSKWSNHRPKKINLVPPPALDSTPSRRRRKVSLAEFKKAKPQPQPPVLVSLPTRCSRCQHFHDPEPRPTGAFKSGYVRVGLSKIPVTGAEGIMHGVTFLPECTAAVHRHPRRACKWFVDFKDLDSVEKTKRAKAKESATFGLTYVPKPASLAERIFAATTEKKARAEKKKKARAGMAAAKERARAYVNGGVKTIHVAAQKSTTSGYLERAMEAG